MGDCSEHFSRAEFRCKCYACDCDDPTDGLLDFLEELRARLGHNPVLITSGHRCPDHNRRVGGASNSQHLYGTAADIVVDGVSHNTVYAEADELLREKFGGGGLGKYNTFTHVDVRTGGPARWGG